MFVRFRQTPSRLQVSLVEPRRIGGKVCQEHVASLGSILTPFTAEGRVEFFRKVTARLKNLSNRIGDDRGKIVSAIVARIPMATDEEITEAAAYAEAAAFIKENPHIRGLARLSEVAFEEFLQELIAEQRRHEKFAARRIIRKKAMEAFRASDDPYEAALAKGFDRGVRLKAALRARKLIK